MPAHRKHGLSRTRVYAAWCNMKYRCYNKTHERYKNYGGKGVTVCDRWLESVLNFVEDMGLPPGENYEISRKNDEGNYEKDNCEWKKKFDNSSEAKRGERHPSSILTEEQVLCIRALKEGAGNNYTAKNIAEELGVNKKTIQNILNYRSWTHI